jgi:hypothetical protein
VPTTGKDFYKKVSRQDELEDRFIRKRWIKPANKYIISIEILVIIIWVIEIFKW